MPMQATISLTGSEDLEQKLSAVAEGLRVFIVENPAPDKPMLGEAHARECHVSCTTHLLCVSDVERAKARAEGEEGEAETHVQTGQRHPERRQERMIY